MGGFDLGRKEALSTFSNSPKFKGAFCKCASVPMQNVKTEILNSVSNSVRLCLVAVKIWQVAEK
jgi:hypothetical protein